MVTAFDATPTGRATIPATARMDGSVRPQVVADSGSRFRRLLQGFDDLTGVHAVLKTSFNDESEPIVASPIDAIKTYKATPRDMLVLETYDLTKR
jgi:carbamoyltransferase